MKTDDELAIIEIIDDDADPFGDRETNTTVYDTSGPRWIGPAAAAALLALMAYGVATSASSNAAPKAAPVTTIAHAPTTTQPPAPTTTVPVPVVPYYSADPPPEYSLQNVQFDDTSDRAIYSPRPGNYQLWATSASTAWLSIETYTGGRLGVAVDAYRVLAGTHSIAISHLTSGQSVAEFTPGGSVSVKITSFGWSDDDLIRLAASVTADQRAIHLNDRSLLDHYQIITSVPPWLSVQGNPVEYVSYSTGQDFRRDVTVTVAPRLPSQAGGDTFDRQIAPTYFFDHAITFDADGHVAVAGTVIGQGDFALASWIANDHIVTISGLVPVPLLIAIAGTVHQVSAQEWAGMQLKAARHSADNDFVNYSQSPPAPVSFGIDAASESWTIEVSTVGFPNQQLISWQWGAAGFGSTADDAAKIQTVVDGRRTYVLAYLPRSVTAAGQLQINRAGLDPVVVPFNDAQPTSDRTFAAYAFSEPLNYTAQILGADGAVLASWPSG
ncbi:MAG: hypothetical protein QOH53_837 [Ilumatobacteraceae bacterium]